MNGDYRTIGGSAAQDGVASYKSFIGKVYGWMAAGLAITAAAAAATVSIVQNMIPPENIPSYRGVFFGAIIVEIVLVMVISMGINKLSPMAAGGLFLLYSLVSGVTLAPVVFAYTSASIAVTFAVTAGTFAAMSLYGYFTKADLTSFGNIMFMGLIGLVIGTLVNIFWANETFYWILTYLGVAVFTGLIAYDTNKLKNIACGNFDNTTTGKLAVIGALSLYLDFINLFLMLLRFFGKRR